MLRRQGTASLNQSSDFDLAVSFGDALFCISSDHLNREILSSAELSGWAWLFRPLPVLTTFLMTGGAELCPTK